MIAGETVLTESKNQLTEILYCIEEFLFKTEQPRLDSSQGVVQQQTTKRRISYFGHSFG